MTICLEQETAVSASSPFLAYVRDGQACRAGFRWAQHVESFEQAWHECPDPDWLVWGLQQGGYDDLQGLRRWACWCARQVWALIPDARSRQAVETAEGFLRGQSTEEELHAAWLVAAPLGEGSWPSAAAAWASKAAAEVAGPQPAGACIAAAEATRWNDPGPDTWKRCRTAQVNQLRHILGEEVRDLVVRRLNRRYAGHPSNSGL